LAFVIYPLSAAHVNDWSDPGQLMQTSSGLLIGYGSGAIFGPLLSSSLMSAFGPAALFAYIALNLFVMMLFALYQSSVAGLQREKMEFVPQPSVQFPVEELFHAAQDDSSPVPEALYDSGESVDKTVETEEGALSVDEADRTQVDIAVSDEAQIDLVEPELQVEEKSFIEQWEEERLAESERINQSDELGVKLTDEAPSSNLAPDVDGAPKTDDAPNSDTKKP